MENNYPDLVAEAKKTGANRVLVQVPEGLKTNAVEILSALEEAGFSVFLSNNPVYGACDLADKEAAMLSCDLLVHIGHNKFYVDTKPPVKVLYYNWPVAVNLDGIDFSTIPEKRIGVMTNIQHMNMVREVTEKLENEGKETHFGGQVLGCYAGNADKIQPLVDAFLFVGSGRFHPLALRGKNTYVLDLEKKEIKKLDASEHEKRRWARIYKAQDANTFGILVTSKAGQFQLLGEAENIKKRIEQAGKKAFIIVMDEITDAKLEGLRVDAFVNTACPRLEDDSFRKPIINAPDLKEVLNK